MRCVLLLAASVLLASAMPPNTGNLWISTIDEPRQCQSTQVVIQGGTAPYQLFIVRGDNYDAQIVQVAADLQMGSIPWTCNVQAGTAFALKLVDCLGNTAYSAARTVENGSSDCCQSSALVVGSPGTNCACNLQPWPQPAPVAPTPPAQQAPPQTYAVPTRYTTQTVRVPAAPQRGNTCYGATPTNTGRWGGARKRAWYDSKVSNDPDTDRSHGEPAYIVQTRTVTTFDDNSENFDCYSSGSRFSPSWVWMVILVLSILRL